MNDEIVICQHCGDNFFKEDVNEKGLCKLCTGEHQRYKVYKTEDSDIDL